MVPARSTKISIVPRGEAGNRIGEQFELFAHRASSATMAANQLRMSFSASSEISGRSGSPSNDPTGSSGRK
jgi:hypothetical protein